jgi:superfamily II DNA or RNA helicase
VDIPRLRVGVFATTTATELFFRQAAGRLVRWTRGMRHQKSFFFIPDDPRLRAFAAQIADQRRHSLRRKDDGDRFDRSDLAPADETAAGAPEEQLSLFSVISAVVLGNPHQPEWVAEEFDHDLGADDTAEDDALVIDLAAPVRSGGGAAAPRQLTRREHKAQLRAGNADRARDIVRMSGLTHAQVNGELNRLSSVGRISEATVEQLESRLGHADRWLSRL